MTKLFKKERFSVFKADRANKRLEHYKNLCHRKLEGDLVILNDVFYLDGLEIFRVSEGTNKEWRKWEQLLFEIDSNTYFIRGWQSKKNWGGGGFKYRDTVRKWTSNRRINSLKRKDEL